MEQNTLKIWDGTENSREERKKVGGWDGFHVLYTERTQFLIVWECAWKKWCKICSTPDAPDALMHLENLISDVRDDRMADIASALSEFFPLIKHLTTLTNLTNKNYEKPANKKSSPKVDLTFYLQALFMRR